MGVDDAKTLSWSGMEMRSACSSTGATETGVVSDALCGEMTTEGAGQVRRVVAAPAQVVLEKVAESHLAAKHPARPQLARQLPPHGHS